MNIKSFILTFLIFTSSVSFAANPIEAACNTGCDIAFGWNIFAWGTCRATSFAVNHPEVVAGAKGVALGLASHLTLTAADSAIDRLGGYKSEREARYQKGMSLKDEQNNLLARQVVLQEKQCDMLKENNDMMRKAFGNPEAFAK